MSNPYEAAALPALDASLSAKEAPSAKHILSQAYSDQILAQAGSDAKKFPTGVEPLAYKKNDADGTMNKDFEKKIGQECKAAGIDPKKFLKEEEASIKASEKTIDKRIAQDKNEDPKEKELRRELDRAIVCHDAERVGQLVNQEIHTPSGRQLFAAALSKVRDDLRACGKELSIGTQGDSFILNIDSKNMKESIIVGPKKTTYVHGVMMEFN